MLTVPTRCRPVDDLCRVYEEAPLGVALDWAERLRFRGRDPHPPARVKLAAPLRDEYTTFPGRAHARRPGAQQRHLLRVIGGEAVHSEIPAGQRFPDPAAAGLPARLTPAPVRRGFCNIRQALPCQAGAPKPGQPKSTKR